MEDLNEHAYNKRAYIWIMKLHVFLPNCPTKVENCMISRYFFFLLVPIFMIPSCNQEKKAKRDDVETIKEEVMRIHDEAMAQMSTIKKLGTKLYGAQSFALYDQWPEELKKELGNILNQLGDAEKSMWNWMYAYKEPGEDKTKQEKIAYLESELEKVKIVHEKIFTSIERAQEFSKKHKIEYANQEK